MLLNVPLFTEKKRKKSLFHINIFSSQKEDSVTEISFKQVTHSEFLNGKRISGSMILQKKSSTKLEKKAQKKYKMTHPKTLTNNKIRKLGKLLQGRRSKRP